MSFVFTPIFSDPFQRANENPLNPATWANPLPSEPLQIVSDQCCAVSTSAFVGIQTPITILPKNQYAKFRFTVGDHDASNFSFAGMFLRTDNVQAGLIPNNGYSVFIIPNGGTNRLSIEAYVNGSQTPVFNGAIVLPAFPFDAAAGLIDNTLYVFINGAESTSFDVSAFAASITSTNTALLISFDNTPTDTSVTNFEAGSLSQGSSGGSSSWVQSQREFINKRGIR